MWQPKAAAQRQFERASQIPLLRLPAPSGPTTRRPDSRYAQVEALLTERVSQRAIVRLTSVSRMTVAKLAQKKQQ